MHLRNWRGFVALCFGVACVVIAAAAMPPKVKAQVPPPDIQQLAGAVSTMARSIAALTDAIERRDSAAADRFTAESVQRQNIAEALDRLTKKLDAQDKR